MQKYPGFTIIRSRRSSVIQFLLGLLLLLLILHILLRAFKARRAQYMKDYTGDFDIFEDDQADNDVRHKSFLEKSERRRYRKCPPHQHNIISLKSQSPENSHNELPSQGSTSQIKFHYLDQNNNEDNYDDLNNFDSFGRKKLNLVIFGDIFHVTRGEPCGILRVWSNLVFAFADILKPPDRVIFLQIVVPSSSLRLYFPKNRRPAPSEGDLRDPFIQSMPPQSNTKRFLQEHLHRLPPGHIKEKFYFPPPVITIPVTPWDDIETVLNRKGIKDDDENAVVILLTNSISHWLERSDLCIGNYLHDVIPETFKYDVSAGLFRSRRYSIYRSNFFVSVSNATTLGFSRPPYMIPPSVVTTAYISASEKFKPCSRDQIAAFRQKYHIVRPYFLFVGRRIAATGIHDHKNGVRMWRAIKLLPRNVLSKVEFVAIGQPPSAAEMKFTSMLNVNRKFITTVSIFDLNAAYCGSLALMFVSLTEGFGIPALECMASGCVPIVSDLTSLPEVVGDAGLYADAYNITSIAEQMYNVYTKPYLRKAKIKLGLERARTIFGAGQNTSIGWRRVAAQVIDHVKFGLKRGVECKNFNNWANAEPLSDKTTNVNNDNNIGANDDNIFEPKSSNTESSSTSDNDRNDILSTNTGTTQIHSNINRDRDCDENGEK